MTIRTAFRRRRTAVLLTTALATLAPALIACGESGDAQERDAEALLNRAFDRPIESADLEIDAELEIDGLAGFEQPLRIRATGPYVRSAGTLPQLDVDVEVSQGVGQTIQTGLLSTGDRVFLKFGGSFFEQPPEQVAQANRRVARDRGRGNGGSLADLGLDPGSWVVDAAVEGEEEVGGVATEHVRGTLDVAAVVADLNRLVEGSAGALGDSGAIPRPLGRRQVERLADSIEDPGFDVYVGKDDDVVRRISLRLEMTVPEEDREDLRGVTGASIRLSAQLEDVGGDQEVVAPRSSSPLSELTRQLGNLSALAGVGGLGDADDGGQDGADGGGGPGTGGSGSGSGSSPADEAPDGEAVDAFERYGQCLERARPDDAESIARCAELLR